MPQFPPAGWTIAAVLGVTIALAAIKLVWGMAQWSVAPRGRVGARFGDERIEVLEWSGHEGYVSAGGEMWQAVSVDTLAPGDEAVFVRAKGLTLEVKKASVTAPAPRGARA